MDNELARRWSSLFDDPELADLQDLLDAAHRSPALQALFPSVSHHVRLNLALSPARGSTDVIMIRRCTDGDYEVDAAWVGEARRVHTVREAIDIAANQLYVNRPNDDRGH